MTRIESLPLLVLIIADSRRTPRGGGQAIRASPPTTPGLWHGGAGGRPTRRSGASGRPDSQPRQRSPTSQVTKLPRWLSAERSLAAPPDPPSAGKPGQLESNTGRGPRNVSGIHGPPLSGSEQIHLRCLRGPWVTPVRAHLEGLFASLRTPIAPPGAIHVPGEESAQIPNTRGRSREDSSQGRPITARPLHGSL